ncbi:MAG: bifunctional phosphoribosylaminoimidazolecarboxamide formyltransferase/IMP cyclohydrolase [Acidobacteriaceae bacterium]
MSLPARALLSVTDKTGIVEFASRLAGLGVEIVSTGGTFKLLREGGVKAIEVSDLTGFPEMLDGRVKTLHPKVHGGILHVRGNAAHREAVERHGIQPIDIVVVNLYEFEETAAKPGVGFEELIENIDIGGPAMIRSAAKNFLDVAVITSPADYDYLARELEETGALSLDTKWKLAQKAFRVTAAYDAAIVAVLDQVPVAGEMPVPQSAAAQSGERDFPEKLNLCFNKLADLRYGENPHQRAASYSDGTAFGIANARQLQGKELSYNNLVDLQAAWELAQEFELPACAIIKHTNPCGSATGPDLQHAYFSALEADPVSAFGGVIGVNREVDGPAAEEIAKLFVEAVAAPSFSAEAKQRFAAKKNLRLLEVKALARPASQWKQISGGLLAQDADAIKEDPTAWEVVSKRRPTAEEMAALTFAWTVCKHVKSNAIVYARIVPGSEGYAQSVGVGAGQMSRVDSCKLGAMKAVLPLCGSVAASDAFFPFPDGVEEIANAGATAIIQPGGSMRDKEVIAVADQLGLAMVVTGVRHFRH